jgi:hypothetical protein
MVHKRVDILVLYCSLSEGKRAELKQCTWYYTIQILRAQRCGSGHCFIMVKICQHNFNLMLLWLQLKRLSWSWNHEIHVCKASACLDIESISPQLGHLEFLLIYMKIAVFTQEDLDVLCTWLLRCVGLKKLWVRNHKISSCLPEKLMSDSYGHYNYCFMG